MKIRYFIPILLVAVVAVSVYKSEELYRFYLTVYYQHFLKETRDKSAEKARALYKEKRYEELDAYAERLLVLYPDDWELRRLKGRAMLKIGRESEGARLLISSLRKGEDILPIERAVEILFREKEYGDLADILSDHPAPGSSFLLYVHGVSLYHVERYAEAERQLAGALNAGKRDYDTRYHYGLALEKNGKTREALDAIKKAYDLDPYREGAGKALSRIYRILKQYDEAKKYLRRTP